MEAKFAADNDEENYEIKKKKILKMMTGIQRIFIHTSDDRREGVKQPVMFFERRTSHFLL